MGGQVTGNDGLKLGFVMPPWLCSLYSDGVAKEVKAITLARRAQMVKLRVALKKKTVII